MVERDVILTTGGLKKIEEELDHLRAVKRRALAERIRDAMEFGDPWENAEYEAAKNEQAFVEGRIASLEGMLRSARIVDGVTGPKGTVQIGTKVRLRDLQSSDEYVYDIVGTVEADPFEAKISHKSPVGEAVLGRRVGDRVKVVAPMGVFQYEILEITPT